MLIKLGKQIKLPVNKHFSVKYGTINALNPQCVFITIHSWATPKHSLRFHKKLRTLSHNVKQTINDSINYDVFHSKYIAEFDMRESGLQKGKQSFVAIDIALYPKDVVPFPNDVYNTHIVNLVKTITSDIKRNRNFTFVAKKQK